MSGNLLGVRVVRFCGHSHKECYKNIGAGEMKNSKKPSQTSRGVPVGLGSPSTTPIIEKIDKIKKLIIDRKVILVDDEGKPLEKVEYSGDYDSEDEVALVDNEMASFFVKKDGYGNDMYEGQEIPNKIRSICDNLDIKVRGRRKK
ncbi:hypothetical protein Tco_0537024 [Tanacetum coccineum]